MLVAWLYDIAEVLESPDRIRLDVKPGVTLYIMPAVIHTVLSMSYVTKSDLPGYNLCDDAESFIEELSSDKVEENSPWELAVKALRPF